MRERDINRKMFHVGHYEVIAGRFRQALGPYMEPGIEVDNRLLHARVALIDLALLFAYRLAADNEDFDPVKFLNRCSPKPEEYPLGELWDVDLYNHSLKADG